MRTSWLSVGLLLGLGGLTWAAEDVAVLYDGGPKLPAGVTIGDWGFTPRPDGLPAYQPTALGGRTYGLRFISQGRYQGTRFDLATPLDGALLGANSAYLELYLRPTTGDTLPGLRATFISATGQTLLAQPADALYPREAVEGPWMRVDLPLAGLPATGAVTRLLLTADDPVDLWLGRLAVVRDPDPMTLAASAFPPAPDPGQSVVFSAAARSGLARPEVTWDFDARDGLAIDATGAQVTHRFAKPGAYTVTCTVRDTAGGKAPVTTTIDVDVPNTP